MIELIFSGFWTFIGFLVLLLAVLQFLESIAYAYLNRQKNKLENLKIRIELLEKQIQKDRSDIADYLNEQLKNK